MRVYGKRAQSGPSRIPARLASILCLVPAVIIVGAASAPRASATTSRCLVINNAIDSSYGSLDVAVDRAAPGSTLWLRGVCTTPSLTLTKAVSIVGQRKPGFLPPAIRILASPGFTEGSLLIVGYGMDVTLDGVTLSGGTGTALFRPGFPLGGAIINFGRLTLHDTTVTGNTADLGGGIWSKGTLILTGATLVSGNTATSRGGGIYAANGRVEIDGTSAVSGNTAEQGGGITVLGTPVLMQDSASVNGNTALYGGGVDVEGEQLQLNDSAEIDGNSAKYDGGGVWDYGGDVVMFGGEVRGNVAGAAGGGILDAGLLEQAGGAITGNSATYGGGVYLYCQGSYLGKYTPSGGSLTGNTPTDFDNSMCI